MSAGEAPGTSIATVVGSSPTPARTDSSVARGLPVRSQLVLILADRAESGPLSTFFGQFHHGRAYEVLAVANRGEAVSVMNRGRPDLIVLDPQMKGLDGLQVQAASRDRPDHPGHHALLDELIDPNKQRRRDRQA